MAEITEEQRATLSAVGRKLVLPRLKPSAETRLARHAFECMNCNGTYSRPYKPRSNPPLTFSTAPLIQSPLFVSK